MNNSAESESEVKEDDNETTESWNADVSLNVKDTRRKKKKKKRKSNKHHCNAKSSEDNFEVRIYLFHSYLMLCRPMVNSCFNHRMKLSVQFAKLMNCSRARKKISVKKHVMKFV